MAWPFVWIIAILVPVAVAYFLEAFAALDGLHQGPSDAKAVYTIDGMENKFANHIT